MSLKFKRGLSPDEQRFVMAINRMTYHRARAMAMGFEFGQFGIREPYFDRMTDLKPDDSLYVLQPLIVTGGFRCMCGRDEVFEFPAEVQDLEYDPCRVLYAHEAFDRKHLLRDGYSLKQVEEFEAKAKAFDLTVPQSDFIGQELMRRMSEREIQTILSTRKPRED